MVLFVRGQTDDRLLGYVYVFVTSLSETSKSDEIKPIGPL